MQSIEEFRKKSEAEIEFEKYLEEKQKTQLSKRGIIMTVAELIEKLKKLEQDAEVTIPYESGVLLVDDEEQTEIVFYKP